MNNSYNPQTPVKKKSKLPAIGVVTLIVAVLCYFLASSVWSTVDSTEYHVKQAALFGTLSVKDKPGTYWKLFGGVDEYDRQLTFYFSKEKLDGGEGAAAQPLGATFMGNGTAAVSGIIKVKLPSSDKLRVKLHRDFGSAEAVKMDLIRNTVAAALKQTGPMFRPEEAFTTGRSEFVSILTDILNNGKFATETQLDTVSTEGNVIVLSKSVIKRDSMGQPVILSSPAFADYGISITLLEIKNFDFDEVTDKLIKTKKESEQKIIAAKADAEKAKQDTKTAIENGKAAIATAEATALVEKKTAVVNAEKEAAVAKQNKIRDELNAEAKLATKKAEAEGDRLKVAAGLSPQEKAKIEKEQAIGVAQALSQWKGPQVVISGGKSGGSGSTMMDALAIRQMLGIAKEMNQQ